MRPKKQIFKPYPAYRYKTDHKPIIVHDKKEDEKRQADGWHKTPFSQVIDQLGDVGNTDLIDAIEKSVDLAAAVVNMLERVEKVRSKKDLRWLAGELGIDIPEGKLSLKELRNLIKDSSKQSDELDTFMAMYKGAPNANNCEENS